MTPTLYFLIYSFVAIAIVVTIFSFDAYKSNKDKYLDNTEHDWVPWVAAIFWPAIIPFALAGGLLIGFFCGLEVSCKWLGRKLKLVIWTIVNRKQKEIE